MNETLEKPKRQNFRRMALLVIPISLVVVYVLWNVSALNFLTYPLRLFVTFVHEAGHSLAAIITGGQVIGFLVSPNGSGLATTAGGTRAIILPAGYIGAALFGAGLFYLANRFPRYSRLISVVIGVGMILFTILFARPDEGGALTAIVIGILFGGVMVGLGWKAPTFLTLLVLDVLAVMTALNAVLDLWNLTQYADTASRGLVVNDAAAFSRQITAGLVPPGVVAFVWALIAVVLLAAAVWFSVLQPLRHEVDASFDDLRQRNNRD